jgi:hypothetical protein
METVWQFADGLVEFADYGPLGWINQIIDSPYPAATAVPFPAHFERIET